MKKISTLLVSISMIFLSAYASVNRNYLPEVKKCDFPQLNVQTTVYVGEEMLIQGTELRGKVLRACLETHLSIMKRFNSMLAMAI